MQRLQAAAGNRATQRVLRNASPAVPPIQRTIAVRDQRFDPTGDPQWTNLSGDALTRAQGAHTSPQVHLFNTTDHFWAWTRGEAVQPPNVLPGRVTAERYESEAQQKLDEARPKRRHDSMTADSQPLAATGDATVLNSALSSAEVALGIPGVVAARNPALPVVTNADGRQQTQREVRARNSVMPVTPPHLTAFNTGNGQPAYLTQQGVNGPTTASVSAGIRTRQGVRDSSYGGHTVADFKNQRSGDTTVRGHLQPDVGTLPRADGSGQTSDTTAANFTPENPFWGMQNRRLLEAQQFNTGGGMVQRERYVPNGDQTRSGVPIPAEKRITMTDTNGQPTAAYRFDQSVDYQAAAAQHEGAPGGKVIASNQTFRHDADQAVTDEFDPRRHEWQQPESAAARLAGPGATPMWVGFDSEQDDDDEALSDDVDDDLDDDVDAEDDSADLQAGARRGRGTSPQPPPPPRG